MDLRYVQRGLILPVHDALRHDLEVGHVAVARTDMLKGVHEFKVRIIALMTKLVARETKNSQLVAVFVRQGIQLNEVPDGRPHIVATLLIRTTLPFS